MLSEVPTEPFVSEELTGKIRLQQASLREALIALKEEAGRGHTAQLAARCSAVARQYRAHETLVDALIEAVEPDRPATPDTRR